MSDRYDDLPLTYDEILAVLDALPVLCREKRRRLGLTYRAAGRASGVSFNAIKRVEDGTADPAWTTARSLLRWIGQPDLPAGSAEPAEDAS